MSQQPDVELRLPAQRAYAAVLRTTTAALAARLDFTVDDLDDLRMAIGEVTAMLLEQAAPGSDLLARYEFGDREIRLEVSTAADEPRTPNRDGFAWQVLSAVTTEVSAEVEPDRICIRVALKSAPLE